MRYTLKEIKEEKELEFKSTLFKMYEYQSTISIQGIYDSWKKLFQQRFHNTHTHTYTHTCTCFVARLSLSLYFSLRGGHPQVTTGWTRIIHTHCIYMCIVYNMKDEVFSHKTHTKRRALHEIIDVENHQDHRDTRGNEDQDCWHRYQKLFVIWGPQELSSRALRAG